MIRPTIEADLQQICQIEKDTFSQPWSEKAFRDSLNNSDYLYMSAVDEDGITVLGYCGALQSFEIADITNMAVKEAYRGRGIGRMLLSAVMQEGYARGIERYTLEVRVSNTAAIHMYESLGYTTEGIRPKFYALPTEDALIMWTKEKQKVDQ